MTTPSNNEPAKSSETYSMDGGVPTGTENLTVKQIVKWIRLKKM